MTNEELALYLGKPLSAYAKDEEERQFFRTLEMRTAKYREECHRAHQEFIEERISKRHANGNRAWVAIGIYLGVGLLLSLLFWGTCPSCAYGGTVTATGLDYLSMLVMLAWGFGGPIAAYAAAERMA